MRLTRTTEPAAALYAKLRSTWVDGIGCDDCHAKVRLLSVDDDACWQVEVDHQPGCPFAACESGPPGTTWQWISEPTIGP